MEIKRASVSDYVLMKSLNESNRQSMFSDLSLNDFIAMDLYSIRHDNSIILFRIINSIGLIMVDYAKTEIKDEKIYKLINKKSLYIAMYNELANFASQIEEIRAIMAIARTKSPKTIDQLLRSGFSYGYQYPEGEDIKYIMTMNI